MKKTMLESAFNSPEEYQAFARKVIDAPKTLYNALSPETKKHITPEKFENMLRARVKENGIKVPVYKKDKDGNVVQNGFHVFRDYDAIVSGSRKGLQKTVEVLNSLLSNNMSQLKVARETIEKLTKDLTAARKNIKSTFDEMERISRESNMSIADMQAEAEAARKNGIELSEKQKELLKTIEMLRKQRDRLMDEKLSVADRLKSYAIEFGEQSEELSMIKKTFAEMEGALNRTEKKAMMLKVKLDKSNNELSKSKFIEQSQRFMQEISKALVANDTRLSRLVGKIETKAMMEIAKRNNIDMAVAGPIISALKKHASEMAEMVEKKAREISEKSDKGSKERNTAAAMDALGPILSANLKMNLEKVGAFVPGKK